ncbi:alpha/beta hydrolase [Cellulophaga baltica]|uniref:carboxylesterase family protein n=1 Tax=Cellulophaga TaxID=104264 RepID=UPI001C0651FA|nr:MULTISPECIES: carboxylesterase family protein [Cellulophaga]MBU2996302.1 alpha/beta hydrolase [Cellulophaga baltica]MDO6767697.1 carboxylesterase family protein [Cellulophaga sp. 1_MG-2023]
MHYKALLIFFLFTILSVNAQKRYIDYYFENTESKTYTYAIRKTDSLKLDIYQPVNDTLSKRPLFIIVHAGGFNSGARNDKSLVSLASKITKKGFVVASIDYRLLGNKESINCDFSSKKALKVYSNAKHDVLDALLFLTNYKSDFKIDTSKIILFGSSAGAETVLNIAYNFPTSAKYKNINITALISISGALLDSNIINKNNAIPSVFYHGVNDKIVPYYTGSHYYCSKEEPGYIKMDGSKMISDKLENLDMSFMMYSYKNEGHDMSNLLHQDFEDAFIFLNKTVFNNENYQVKLIK